MSLIMAEARVFRRLKPFCVQVAQQPTFESISDLKATLQLVTKAVFKEESMVQYVLFPLKLTIQRIKHSNEKILLVTLDCICLLFSHHNVVSEKLLLEIFDICCVLLSSQKQSVGEEMLARISEELKIKIVNIMNILFLGSTTSVLLCLYSDPVLPRLGHAVSILLCLSEFEKDRELRLASIECLQNLTLKHKSMNDHELQLVSDAFCSFIPGISMAFSRILLDSSNTGQAVFASVIETLTDFIVLVMGDCRFSFLQQSKGRDEIAMELKMLPCRDQQSKLPNHYEIHDEKSFIVKRDKKWLEKTASNISILIKRFASRVAHHSSPKVRLSTVSFAESLLSKCGTSMDGSVPTVIEMLAGMQHDEYDVVAMEARRAIECCRLVLEIDGRSLNAAIQDKLYEKLLSLPRIMKNANDEDKLINLNVLLGYFNLFGDRLADVLNSLSVLEKLLKSFVQALELEVHDVKIIEEKNPVSSEDMINQNSLVPVEMDFLAHRFKNFNDGRIFQTIQKICYSIGRFAEFNVVIDYLLEQFLSSSVQRKEIVLFLNEVLRCRIEIEENAVVTKESNSSTEVVVDQLISTYLREEFWFLPTSNANDVHRTTDFLEDRLALLRTEDKIDQLSYWEKGLPIEQINSNIQLICLMIKGISICSGIRNFNVFLIKVMYPLMEKLGNENALIANTALNALSVISRNCERAVSGNGSRERGMVEKNSGSIAELISENSDYLINSISMSFRHLTLLSSAPCVLSVMLLYSDKDILPTVADVIQDVFHFLDLYQEEVAISLMKVLKSLALAMQAWFGKEGNNDEFKGKTAIQDWNKPVNPRELGEIITEYCRNKVEALGEVESDDEAAELIGNPEEENDANQDDDAYSAEKKKTPVHFEVTLTALEKCKHFLPSKDTLLQQLSLDVVEACVIALRQRQDDLLPVLHKIWPSIVGRIKESQSIILLRTINVVITMVDCTGDFLAQRMTKDIYPFIVEYLTRNRNMSQKGGPMYRFSHTCKIQTKMLNLISNVIQKLGLSNEDLWQIAVVCAGYLDCRQPLSLQFEACNVFHNLSKVDWSTAWLILTSLHSSEDLSTPNSCFKDIHVNKDCFKRNEFTDNVKKVLYHDDLSV